jgi:two-component system, LytTR family, response regulator
MKVLIIDNERPEVSAIEAAQDIPTGLALIRHFQPDLLFLDVELDHGTTGFDLLRQLSNPAFQLVFVTAWDKYAIEAFRFSAVDFLLKPVDPEALQNCIQKTSKTLKNQHLTEQIAYLLARLNTPQDATPKRIVLKDAEHIYYVRTSDIYYCEADGVYTKFFLENHQVIIVSKNLKEYAQILEPLGFLRSHNSFLVNPTKITRYDKTSEQLILEGGHLVPLSHRKKDWVLSVLGG